MKLATQHTAVIALAAAGCAAIIAGVGLLASWEWALICVGLLAVFSAVVLFDPDAGKKKP